MISRADVEAVLAEIPEPCSISMGNPVSLVEMGIVDSIDIDQGRVRVELVLTDASCVHFNSMGEIIRKLVGEVEGVMTVDVGLSRSKMWMPPGSRLPLLSDTDT